MSHAKTQAELAALPIERDRDQFLRELLRELAATLEGTVGLDEAAGYISIVGNRIGAVMDREYRKGLDRSELDREQVAAALVDLKRRIEGGFSIESVDRDRIVLVNDRCPFGAYVAGRSSLCMMTSSVFGRITADNLGYSAVDLKQTIARGDAGCRVVVHLTQASAADSDDALEYFGVDT